MNLALDDDEAAALARVLRHKIDEDRYPLSPRVRQLQSILDATASELCEAASSADVYRAMTGRIASAWPDGEFPHHGGHGIGLGVCDDPHVIPSDAGVLESWMVLALEPGVYLPGRFGVRKENLFLVAPDGAVELAGAMRRPLSDRALSGWSA